MPSLYTFFEDFKYLESCVHCVKWLCGHLEMSIWSTLHHMFIAASETKADCLIQTSESTFQQMCTESMECLDLAYWQIWLYAMWYYSLMPSDSKSEDELLVKLNCVKADECVVYEMAELTHCLGFCSSEITALMNQSSDRQIAWAALLQARKLTCFWYETHVLDMLIDWIVDCFSAAVLYQLNESCELLTDSCVKHRAQCSMP